MTVGQRIAQKRKELGLSQETLGEQLGVSRQAIYKWEADATLPEIEKLIALSRIFGVSVGWLLGEEDQSAPTELSEQQLLMVQEIVERYLAARSDSESNAAPWWPEAGNSDLTPEQRRLVSAVAERVQANQPPQEPPKRRRWPWVIAIAACLAIIISLFSLSEQLRSLDNQTHYLQSSMQMIETSVSNQIGSITGRVEEILKSQNQLTADYSTQAMSIDETASMITFSFRVVPKTYQEGMQAWVDVVNEDTRTTFGPYSADREVFSGNVTVPLTDYTAIYFVFEYNGIRQTQLLDTYENLYSYSFPSCWLDAWPLFFDVDDTTNQLTEDLYADLTQYDPDNSATQVRDYRIGLFADQTLVTWFIPTTRQELINGEPIQETIYKLSKDENIIFDQSKTYCIAAVATDEYGRQFVVSDIPMHWTDSGWSSLGTYSPGPYFEGWTY